MPRSEQDTGNSRNDLAEDRNLLAIERTFAAWLRTGLGALAVGIAFERLFPETEPTWISKAGASFLIVLAVAIFTFSLWAYRRSTRRLSRHTVPRVPMATPVALVVLASFAAVIAGTVMWLF
jgi:putative membrane protein